jgi:hypothetical protein
LAVSAQAGWYPDPGGGQGLFRYWDGAAWSAATSLNPSAPAPAAPLGSASSAPVQPTAQTQIGTGYGQSGSMGSGYGQAGSTGSGYGHPGGYPNASANYQIPQKKKSLIGWWLGAAALLVVIIVVAVFVIRGLSGGDLTTNPPGGQPSEETCPAESTPTTAPNPDPADGRVHGGPVSYPELRKPWSAPQSETRVPFGADVASQEVVVEPNYAPKSQWVASVLVGELQAGDGFFTPEQGSVIVVKCILGRFYGDNEVASKVKVNKATTIDGHQAWLVESQLSFDIPNLKTKGELLIVAIVSTGATAGLFYASIPDTRPDLVQPARDALKNLQVDG